MVWEIVKMVLVTGMLAAVVGVITWHFSRPKPKPSDPVAPRREVSEAGREFMSGRPGGEGGN